MSTVFAVCSELVFFACGYLLLTGFTNSLTLVSLFVLLAVRFYAILGFVSVYFL